MLFGETLKAQGLKVLMKDHTKEVLAASAAHSF